MERHFPPTPRGHYAIAFSDEIREGAIVRTRAFGRELVIFRGRSGNVGVVDAHCAHLGAHLGEGGRVVGDCIECPFHRWQWQADGRCRSIPYSDRIPNRARLGAREVTERDGLVFVAHGIGGDEDAAPDAPPIEVPHPAFLDDPEVEVLARRTFTLATHVQDLVENAVDTAHFPALHAAAMPALEVRYEGARMHVGFEAEPIVFGRKLTRFPRARIDITSIGLTNLTVETRYQGLPDAALLQYPIPTDGDELTIRHLYVARTGRGLRKHGRRALAGLSIAASLLESRRDLRVWQHKIYQARPVLADSDGPIGPFREWASQFYPGTRSDRREAVGRVAGE